MKTFIEIIIEENAKTKCDKIIIETVPTGVNYFYELWKNQEPLGEEFKQVLNDNLWELYEK